MHRRSLLFSLVLISSACSQRAPWRVIPTPAPPASKPAPLPAPASATGALPAPALVLAAADATAVALGTLQFPVPAVDSSRIDDSFDARRDGGRKHKAIDIMAPRGAAILSVQDGRILRLSRGGNGGIAIYATDDTEQFVFYYAHLDSYHKSIYVGRPVLRGDTLGFVGSTGNAPESAPHLHFQVMRMPSDHRFWNGEPINPYPLLRWPTLLEPGR